MFAIGVDYLFAILRLFCGLWLDLLEFCITSACTASLLQYASTYELSGLTDYSLIVCYFNSRSTRCLCWKTWFGAVPPRSTSCKSYSHFGDHIQSESAAPAQLVTECEAPTKRSARIYWIMLCQPCGIRTFAYLLCLIVSIVIYTYCNDWGITSRDSGTLKLTGSFRHLHKDLRWLVGL